MKAAYWAADPDTIPFTLQITLPMKEWKRIADDLGTDMHQGPRLLRDLITDVVLQARKDYYPERKSD